ncbi:MAG: permease [Nanobdellota archaeon]
MKFKESLRQSAKQFINIFPMLIGVLLLVSFLKTAIPNEAYKQVFTDNILIDPLVGAIIGSISAGNPMISYVLGGEFLDMGISLIAVTAFLVAWVTVGIVQLPVEISTLGKRFAIKRNILSFFFAIITAIIVTVIL